VGFKTARKYLKTSFVEVVPTAVNRRTNITVCYISVPTFRRHTCAGAATSKTVNKHQEQLTKFTFVDIAQQREPCEDSSASHELQGREKNLGDHKRQNRAAAALII